jgi:hypothetical protein
MARIAHTNMVICDGCGVEITWSPVVVGKRSFCCRDCAEGRACDCDFPPEERAEKAEMVTVPAY